MGECSIEAIDAGSGRLKGSTSAKGPLGRNMTRSASAILDSLVTVKVVNCSAHVSEEMLGLESRR